MNSLPGPNEPYRILRSDPFHADWDAGVAAGWLNPMVHPAQLEHFTRSVLPADPFFGRPAHGAPVNVREIQFPLAPGDRGVIMVTYFVIEDDHTVLLDRIYLIP